MPNKRGHQRITSLALLPATVSYLVVDPISATCFMSGIIITLRPELGPDLDSDARKFNWIGKLIGMKSYAKAVPHRRGIRHGDLKKVSWTTVMTFSHIPLFGTFPRFLIIAYPITIGLLLMQVNPIEYWQGYIAVWIGMSYSDFWHVAADILSGEFYRKYMRPSYWARRFWYGTTRKERRRLYR